MIDPVCSGCQWIPQCISPCPPVRWIDGHAARREPLLRDMASSGDHAEITSRDYNTIIADVLRSRTGRLDDIRDIQDMRIRAIAAMALADIGIRQIERLLHLRNGAINNTIPPKK